MYRLDRLTPTTTVYKMSDIIPLPVIIKIKTSLHIYKILHHEILSNTIIETNSSSNRPSRNAHCVIPPRFFSTTYGSRSILNVSIQNYNSLHPDVCAIIDIGL